jgi:hypothetical protein
VALGAVGTIVVTTAPADEPPSELELRLLAERDRARAYADRLEHVVHRETTRAERNERKLRRARYTLRNRYRPAVTHIIAVAASAFGQSPSALIRKADCETGGTFSPYSYNRSSGASGLFQFLGSTWRSTPLAGQSPFDPFASALAAAWMHRQGRGGEWVCR